MVAELLSNRIMASGEAARREMERRRRLRDRLACPAPAATSGNFTQKI